MMPTITIIDTIIGSNTNTTISGVITIITGTMAMMMSS